jgi:peptide/nickel transport system ATP-binding protein
MSIVFQDPFTSLNPAITVGGRSPSRWSGTRACRKPPRRTEVARLLVEVGIPNPSGGGARRSRTSFPAA